MAAFDFKKEYPEFYLPARSPHLIEIPELPYLAVRGSGDPNAEGGEYKDAVGMLYAVAYTIKMSRLSGSAPEGISTTSCRRSRAFGGRRTGGA